LEAAESGNELATTEDLCLVVQPWWMNHLLECSRSGGSASSAEARAQGALKVLRWAYGAVVNTTGAHAADRRRELLSGKTADAALLQLYEDIAQIWRRLNEQGTKKTRLQQLR
jgi:hypothetical protein